MGLGSLIGAMVSGAGKITAAAANKNKDKNKGSGSSGSSGGGSSGGGSSSGNKYGNYNNSGTGGFQGSADEYDRLTSLGEQLSQKWHETNDPIEKKSLHDQAVLNNAQLGKSYDDSTGTWSGGYSRPNAPSYDYEGEIGGAYDRAEDAYREAQEQAAKANQAKVDSAISDLNAQKGQVGDLTAKNNAAAEQAYMQTINPNGSLAENLARAGLLSTGLTESSQISAGNEYQNALNQNATTQTETIAEIERAITKAQLEGDLSTAEALSGMLTQIAQLGIDRADKIAGWKQWQQQFDYNKGVTDAGLTGVYNNQQTMAGQAAQDSHQAAQDQHELNQLSAESQRIANELSRKYGVSLQELQIEAQRLQNEGYTLDNAYKALENKYAKTQFGG